LAQCHRGTLATVAILAHAPAFADKPATMLDGAKPVTITAIPATSIATILSERRSASSCGEANGTCLPTRPIGRLLDILRRSRRQDVSQHLGRRHLVARETIAGDVLLEAIDALNIDNMEGIAAHRSASGETMLTLISDDNYSPLQRTLLKQFAIPGGKPVLAEPTSR
jgi:hypothetical protein